MRFLKLSSGCFGTPELGNRTMPVLDLTNDPSAFSGLSLRNRYKEFVHIVIIPFNAPWTYAYRFIDKFPISRHSRKYCIGECRRINKNYFRRISVEQNKRASIEGIDEVSATIGTTGSDEERFRIRASKRRERSRYVKIERGTEREGSEGGTS